MTRTRPKNAIEAASFLEGAERWPTVTTSPSSERGSSVRTGWPHEASRARGFVILDKESKIDAAARQGHNSGHPTPASTTSPAPIRRNSAVEAKVMRTFCEKHCIKWCDCGKVLGARPEELRGSNLSTSVGQATACR